MPPLDPTSPANDVHRLRDILVEEVSVVDRAANKRRWLIVKRETGMPPELQQSSDGRGDLTFSDGAKETAPAPAAKAGEAAGDPAAEGAAPAGALSLPAAVKGLVVGILTDAMERLMALVNKVQDASVPADSEPGDLTVPPEIGTAITDVTDRLGAFMKQYKVGKAAEAEKPAAGTPAPAQKAAPAAAAPAGAPGKPKLSPARLARFEKTFALLESLLQELSPLVPTPAQAAAAVAAATPVASSASGAAPAQKRAPAPAAPPQIPAVIVAQLAELKKGLEQAQAVTKTVEEQAAVIKAQAAELAKLRKSVPASQVTVVDQAPAAGRPGIGGDPVSWPMDLNREVRRDKVDKSVSFFEVG